MTFEESMRKKYTRALDHEIKFNPALEYNIQCLDQYDFSEFFKEGKSFQNIYYEIEERYDGEFKQRFGIYVFDDMQMDDAVFYFGSRYNLWFQEYIDWVVRHNNGPYGKTRKRIKNCA